MPYGSLLHLFISGVLTLELFVKGEDGFLRGGVDVACSATARAKLGAGLGETGGEEGGWASGSGSVGGLGGLEGVACSAASTVNVIAGSWVRLGDLVAGWHCDGGCVELRKVV